MAQKEFRPYVIMYSRPGIGVVFHTITEEVRNIVKHNVTCLKNKVKRKKRK